MAFNKKGDGGFSTISSNMKISKDDERFYALGDTEELSGHLELCKVLSSCEKFIGNIERIQGDLAKISDSIKQPNDVNANITVRDIEHLESEIARCEKVLENQNVSEEVDKNEFYARIKLTEAVSRRAERDIVKAGKRYFITSEVKAYMNRLSSLLNVWAKVSLVDGIKKVEPCKIDPETIVDAVVKQISGENTLTLDLAKKLAERVIEYAKTIGKKLVIAVSNAQGRPMLVEVMDDAFLVSFNVAIKKTYTCCAVKMSTAKLVEEVKEGGSLKGLESDDSLIYLGGGEPLYIGYKLVGAIGISGGTGEEDTAIARKAKEMFDELVGNK